MTADTYNTGAKEEMRVVRNAIVRAVEVEESVYGYFVHCACYVKNVVGIAIENNQSEGLYSWTWSYIEGTLGNILQPKLFCMDGRNRRQAMRLCGV